MPFVPPKKRHPKKKTKKVASFSAIWHIFPRKCVTWSVLNLSGETEVPLSVNSKVLQKPLVVGNSSSFNRNYIHLQHAPFLWWISYAPLTSKFKPPTPPKKMGGGSLEDPRCLCLFLVEILPMKLWWNPSFSVLMSLLAWACICMALSSKIKSSWYWGILGKLSWRPVIQVIFQWSKLKTPVVTTWSSTSSTASNSHVSLNRIYRFDLFYPENKGENVRHPNTAITWPPTITTINQPHLPYK